MSLSIEEVHSLLYHNDATYCVKQLEQWLTTLTNKPYLQTQSFYPCYTLICTRIFSKLPVNQSVNHSVNQSNNQSIGQLQPLIRTHPAICSVNSPLFQLIFKHAAFPPYFALSLDQLPRSTRVAIVSNQSINQSINQSPIAARFSSCFDRSKNQLDLSIQEYFMFMFALAAHDQSVNQPVIQSINQPKVDAPYESLIKQYMQAFNQSENFDTFLAIAVELWLGFSIIVRDQSINQSINQSVNQLDLVPLSASRIFLPQILIDRGRLCIDSVLVRALHSCFMQLRGPFDQKTANLLQLWIEAMTAWQSISQPNNQPPPSAVDPADLALAIALHSSMFLTAMRSLTTIDLGREGSSSRSFAFELVTHAIKLIISFESWLQAVEATLSESSAMQQALASRPRNIGAAPIIRVEGRAAAIRGHYLRLIGDLNDVDGNETHGSSVDALVTTFQQQSQLVCFEFARELSPRARAGVSDPNWQQFTSVCRSFVGPELDTVLNGEKRAPVNNQVHLDAAQQQSLEPERDATAHLTAAGREALIRGTALCARRAMPVRGDPMELPATSHESEIVLDGIRQARQYFKRNYPELTFMQHKQWRVLARHEFLYVVAFLFLIMLLMIWLR